MEGWKFKPCVSYVYTELLSSGQNLCTQGTTQTHGISLDRSSLMNMYMLYWQQGDISVGWTFSVGFWGNTSAWYGLLLLLSSCSSSFTSAFGTTTFSFQNYPTSLFLALPRYALLRDLRCLCWAMLHIYMHMMHIYAAYNLCLVISFFWSKQGHLIFLKVSKTVSF